MPESFDRDKMAEFYAKRHKEVDAAIKHVYYLPDDAPEREIRLVEVTDPRSGTAGPDFEPIDFGVDIGTDGEHKLIVVDGDTEQWNEALTGERKLPPGWSLKGHRELPTPRRRKR